METHVPLETHVPDLVKTHPAPAVLFCGAGASAHLEKPVMSRFFARFVGPDLSSRDAALGDDAARLLGACIGALYPGDLDEGTPVAERGYDLEDVLQLLDDLEGAGDVGELLGRQAVYEGFAGRPGFGGARATAHALRTASKVITGAGRQQAESARTVAKDLRRALNALVFRAYRSVEGDRASAIALYSEVLSALVDNAGEQSAGVAIFTTNYDQALEAALEGWGAAGPRKFAMRPVEGFGPVLRRDLAPATWEEYNRKYWEIEAKAGTVRTDYFKLHGSLGWREKQAVVFRCGVEQLPDDEAERPVVIFPGAKTRDLPAPYGYFHRALTDYLMRARLCIVIGFAMRDEAITDCFTEALKGNPDLALCFVMPPPTPAGVAGFADAEPNRVQVVPHPFETRDAKGAVCAAVGRARLR